MPSSLGQDDGTTAMLQKVILGTMCCVEENRLKSREVAAENGLSVTARHEAAATDQRDPQMKEAEGTQHVGSDLEVI